MYMVYVRIDVSTSIYIYGTTIAHGTAYSSVRHISLNTELPILRKTYITKLIISKLFSLLVCYRGILNPLRSNVILVHRFFCKAVKVLFELC